MKKLTVLIIALTFTLGAYAQENPIRIGLKFGWPIIAGLNAEYVTPAVGGRLAPNIDFSRFSISVGDAESAFTFLEIGSNFYFNDTGKGAYANLSYGRIGWKGSFSDATLGDGEVKLGINRVHLKLGAKLGNSFYFRPELGYAIGLGDSEVTVEYDNNGTITEQTEEIPGVFTGGVMLNLGFGFAF